jgi:hypothetical protein
VSDNGPELLKLYVEEMNDPNNLKTLKRAYKLNNIESQQLSVVGSHNSVSPITSTAGVKTISDLFDVVKQKDKSFDPKPSSAVVDTDGTEFILDKEKDTESQSARVTDENEGQRSAKDSVSNNKLTRNELIVKNNISDGGEIYSIPNSTIERKTILNDLANGTITVEQAEKLLGRTKTHNPAQISNLSERDADTTASEHKRKQGENRGDGESKFYGSLMKSNIFDLQFKDEMKDDSFIEKYKTVTNKETLPSHQVNKPLPIRPKRTLVQFPITVYQKKDKTVNRNSMQETSDYSKNLQKPKVNSPSAHLHSKCEITLKGMRTAK